MPTNWDKNKPAGTDKLRDSDDMIRDNWGALQDALQRNHEFPGDEGNTAGEHTVVELQDQVGDPETPAGIVAIYNNANGLFARLQSNGDIFKINQARFTQVKSAAYTAVVGDIGNVLLVDGETTITLDPAATLKNGWFLYVKKTDASNIVTIEPDGSETIDGLSSAALDTRQDVVAIVCDGSDFHIIALQSTKPFITFENSHHDHSDSANGGNLGDVEGSSLKLTSTTETDTNTLTKGNIVKAWVNFNGSTGVINGSYNVSSTFRSSTGKYTINWDTNFANTNYCVVASADEGGGNGLWVTPFSLTVGSAQIDARNVVNDPADAGKVYVIAMGDQ